MRPVKDGLGNAYRHGFRIGLDRGYDVPRPDGRRPVPRSRRPPVAARRAHRRRRHGHRLAVRARRADPPLAVAPAGPLEVRQPLHPWPCSACGSPTPPSGFRAWRAETSRTIDVLNTTGAGYLFQIEIAYRVMRAGERLAEVPITFTDRVRGLSKMSGAVIVEELTNVTWWGLRDRVLRRR